MRAAVPLALLLLAACHGPRPVPPADCPLAQLHEGMGMQAATNIVGKPTDHYTSVTGKVAIPFYFGDDAVETIFFYKGVGRAIFKNGPFHSPVLDRVECDPTEPGYKRD